MKRLEFQSLDNMKRKQLKWEKPLNRKNAIKEFMEKMRRPKPFSQEKVKEMSKPWMKRKTPLRSKSKRREGEDKEYNEKKKIFLFQHDLCEVWLSQHELDSNRFDDRIRAFAWGCPRATEIHHKCCGKNRKATYLREDTWMAVSAWGHDFIHKNPKLAYERGWLLKAIPEEPKCED